MVSWRLRLGVEEEKLEKAEGEEETKEKTLIKDEMEEVKES